MPVPDFQTLMLPVLKAAAAGEVRLSELIDRLAEEFHLSDDEKAQLLPSGRQTTLANRTGWAKTYLAKAGLVRSTRRGYFQATDRGQEVLTNRPERIDIGFLSRFPEFEEFRKSEPEETTGPGEHTGEAVEGSKETPDELLRATHGEIEKTLRAELLDRVLQASPAFFENIIVTLLVSMGTADRGRRLGAPSVEAVTTDLMALLIKIRLA